MSEFRIIPVVRYIVTHHYALSTSDGGRQMGCTDTIGEFESEKAANRVLDAMIQSGAGVMAQQVAVRAED